MSENWGIHSFIQKQWLARSDLQLRVLLELNMRFYFFTAIHLSEISYSYYKETARFLSFNYFLLQVPVF